MYYLVLLITNIPAPPSQNYPVAPLRMNIIVIHRKTCLKLIYLLPVACSVYHRYQPSNEFSQKGPTEKLKDRKLNTCRLYLCLQSNCINSRQLLFFVHKSFFLLIPFPSFLISCLLKGVTSL